MNWQMIEPLDALPGVKCPWKRLIQVDNEEETLPSLVPVLSPPARCARISIIARQVDKVPIPPIISAGNKRGGSHLSNLSISSQSIRCQRRTKSREKKSLSPISISISRHLFVPWRPPMIYIYINKNQRFIHHRLVTLSTTFGPRTARKLIHLLTVYPTDAITMISHTTNEHGDRGPNQNNLSKLVSLLWKCFGWKRGVARVFFHQMILLCTQHDPQSKRKQSVD